MQRTIRPMQCQHKPRGQGDKDTRRRFFGLLVSLSLLMASGCQQQKPLKHEQSKSVEPQQTWAVSLDPPIREQKIAVVVTSAGVPVDVAVVLEGDPNKAQELGNKALVDNQPIAGALATQQKTENATLEATIPANKGFSVVVNNPNQKSADVKLKVTSK